MSGRCWTLSISAHSGLLTFKCWFKLFCCNLMRWFVNVSHHPLNIRERSQNQAVGCQNGKLWKKNLWIRLNFSLAAVMLPSNSLPIKLDIVRWNNKGIIITTRLWVVVLWKHGLRQAVEEVWVFVICLHRVRAQRYSVRLCVGARCVAEALDIFRAPPTHHSSSC